MWESGPREYRAWWRRKVSFMYANNVSTHTHISVSGILQTPCTKQDMYMKPNMIPLRLTPQGHLFQQLYHKTARVCLHWSFSELQIRLEQTHCKHKPRPTRLFCSTIVINCSHINMHSSSAFSFTIFCKQQCMFADLLCWSVVAAVFTHGWC